MEEIYGQLVITKEIIKLLVIDYKIKGDYKKYIILININITSYY